MILDIGPISIDRRSRRSRGERKDTVWNGPFGAFEHRLRRRHDGDRDDRGAPDQSKAN